MLPECSWTDGETTAKVQETRESLGLTGPSETGGETLTEELLSLKRELEESEYMERELLAYRIFT